MMGMWCWKILEWWTNILIEIEIIIIQLECLLINAINSLLINSIKNRYNLVILKVNYKKNY